MRTTQPNAPLYDLEVINKYPVYKSRPAFKAAKGVEAPIYDPTKSIKLWQIPVDEAGDLEDDYPLTFDVAFKSNGGFEVGPDGYVKPSKIGMTVAEALSINIPPDLGTSPGFLNLQAVRTPIELLPNERLVKQPTPTGALSVKRLDWVATPYSGYNDRELLEAIATRAGVPGKQ